MSMKNKQQKQPTEKSAEPQAAVASGYDRQPADPAGSREPDPARPSPDGAAKAPAVHEASDTAQEHGTNPQHQSADAITPHGT